MIIITSSVYYSKHFAGHCACGNHDLAVGIEGVGDGRQACQKTATGKAYEDTQNMNESDRFHCKEDNVISYRRLRHGRLYLWKK